MASLKQKLAETENKANQQKEMLQKQFSEQLSKEKSKAHQMEIQFTKETSSLKSQIETAKNNILSLKQEMAKAKETFQKQAQQELKDEKDKE